MSQRDWWHKWGSCSQHDLPLPRVNTKRGEKNSISGSQGKQGLSCMVLSAGHNLKINIFKIWSYCKTLFFVSEPSFDLGCLEINCKEKIHYSSYSWKSLDNRRLVKMWDKTFSLWKAGKEKRSKLNDCSFLILYKWGIFSFKGELLMHHIMSRTTLAFIFTCVQFSTNPFFCRELIFSIGLSQDMLFCCGYKTSLDINLVNNDATFSVSLIYMLVYFFFPFFFPLLLENFL